MKPEKARIRVDVTKMARHGRVARVTIDNAAKANALNSQLVSELHAAMLELSRDPQLRCVVLTGAGDKAFCGGADVKELGTLDADGVVAFVGRVHEATASIRNMPVPVIARLQGLCLGAGLQLALACDTRVAVNTARLGMPETRIGIPSVVEAALLPRLVGWGRATRILVFSQIVDAVTAQAWGLVEEAVDAKELDIAIDRLVDVIVDSGAAAVRAQKALMRTWETRSLDESILAGIPALAEALKGIDPRQLIADAI